MTYTPGVAQKLTVTVTDPTNTVGGYILTSRLASSVSTQAGSFTTLDANNTAAGMDVKAASFSPMSWSFDWTPPATSSGNVNFYVTGIAVSATSLTSGNGIYQAQYTLTPAAAADFSLSGSASSLAVTQGSTSSADTITVTPSNGFTGSVSLSTSTL